MSYRIIGVSPDGKDRFVHSCGYYQREKAQERIDTGDVKLHLMRVFKDYNFHIEEETRGKK